MRKIHWDIPSQTLPYNRSEAQQPPEYRKMWLKERCNTAGLSRNEHLVYIMMYSPLPFTPTFPNVGCIPIEVSSVIAQQPDRRYCAWRRKLGRSLFSNVNLFPFGLSSNLLIPQVGTNRPLILSVQGELRWSSIFSDVWLHGQDRRHIEIWCLILFSTEFSIFVWYGDVYKVSVDVVSALGNPGRALVVIDIVRRAFAV